MSRQFFKIFSLALLAVVVVWGTMAAQKVAAAGGGGNKDIPLIAIFSETDSFGNECKIRNDNPFLMYTYEGSKPGMNYIVIDQPGTAGDFRMGISGKSGRWVNLYFNNVLQDPRPIDQLNSVCLHPYFIYPRVQVPVQTTMISIITTYECQLVSHGDWTELIRTQNILNFTKMNKGETKYVSGRGNTILFQTKDDPTTRKYDESQDTYCLVVDPQFYVVKAGDWDQDGIMDWILTPFYDAYKMLADDGTTYVDYPWGTVIREVSSSGQRICDHGTYVMPFELKIARMK